MLSNPRTGFIVLAILSLVLSMISTDGWLQYAMPDWLALIVIWWNLHRPELVNVGLAWLFALLLDICYGSLLGQHALAMAAISYIAIRLHRQYELFSILLQILLVIGLLALYRTLLFWTFGATGTTIDASTFWNPLLLDLLIWPWLTLVLSHVYLRKSEDRDDI